MIDGNVYFRDPEKDQGEDNVRMKLFEVLGDEMKKKALYYGVNALLHTTDERS